MRYTHYGIELECETATPLHHIIRSLHWQVYLSLGQVTASTLYWTHSLSTPEHRSCNFSLCTSFLCPFGAMKRTYDEIMKRPARVQADADEVIESAPQSAHAFVSLWLTVQAPCTTFGGTRLTRLETLSLTQRSLSRWKISRNGRRGVMRRLLASDTNWILSGISATPWRIRRRPICVSTSLVASVSTCVLFSMSAQVVDWAGSQVQVFAPSAAP